MFARLRRLLARLARVPQQIELLQQGVGRLEMRQTVSVHRFEDAEFRVFSQWGEDGLIQHLIRSVPIGRRFFIEFGVEDYTEANTRFLLQQCNWSGLVLDGSSRNVATIKASGDAWRHDLTAVCAFVNAANINALLAGNGATGDVGLMSVDIDGMDFWVWRAIDVAQPRIVICEYNGLFGPSAAVSVAYDPLFERRRAHYSCLLAGASLSALSWLGREKGYRLVGTNSTGNNAFFVRKDVVGVLPEVTPESIYRRPGFREARNRDGTLALLQFESAHALIADAEVVDVVTGKRVRVGEACALG